MASAAHYLSILYYSFAPSTGYLPWSLYRGTTRSRITPAGAVSMALLSAASRHHLLCFPSAELRPSAHGQTKAGPGNYHLTRITVISPSRRPVVLCSPRSRQRFSVARPGSPGTGSSFEAPHNGGEGRGEQPL